MMNRKLAAVFLSVFFAYAHVSMAETEIHENIRLSVKVLLESDGALPNYRTYEGDRNERFNQLVQAADKGNRSLIEAGTPLRVDLLETVELEGLSNWNAYSEVEPVCPESGDGENDPNPDLPDCCPPADDPDRPDNDCGYRLRCLDRKARNNPELYAFREDAINAYVLSCTGSFNNGGLHDGIVIFRPNAAGPNVLHEVGHHLSLAHTHSGETPVPCGFSCGSLSEPERLELPPGNDQVSDTAADNTCWTINDMSLFNCDEQPYEQADPACKLSVDNTYANLMSYHDVAPANAKYDVDLESQSRITFGQFERIRAQHRRKHPHQCIFAEDGRKPPAPPNLPLFQNALLRLPVHATNWTATTTWVPKRGERNDEWVRELTFFREVFFSSREFDIKRLDSEIVGEYYEHKEPIIGLHNDALVFSPDPGLLANDGVRRDVTYSVRVRDDGDLDLRVSIYNRDTRRFSEENITLEKPSWWWFVKNRPLDWVTRPFRRDNNRTP